MLGAGAAEGQAIAVDNVPEQPGMEQAAEAVGDISAEAANQEPEATAAEEGLLLAGSEPPCVRCAAFLLRLHGDMGCATA